MLDKFLKEAKALLDHILGGYNVYDKTFNFNDTNKFPDPELESKMKNLIKIEPISTDSLEKQAKNIY